MEEVSKQIGPLAATVGRMDKTLRSLYRNGSDAGGPPGYLETAREEDKQQFSGIAKDMKELKEFKDTISQYVLLAKDREKRQEDFRKKVLKIGWKVTTVIFAGLAALGTWTYHELAPVAKTVWDDYLKSHPALSSELKKLSWIPNPVVSSFHRQPALDAGADFNSGH
jgi:hypothetical protein